MRFLNLITAINTLPYLDLQPTFVDSLKKVLNTSNYQELQRINELRLNNHSTTANSPAAKFANADCEKGDILFLNKMQLAINEILRNKNFQNNRCLETVINGQSISLLLHTLLINIIELCPNNKVNKRVSVLDNMKSNIYLCPLSNEPMKSSDESITLTSGYIYNLDNLIQWFDATKNLICPVTKIALTPFDVTNIF